MSGGPGSGIHTANSASGQNGQAPRLLLKAAVCALCRTAGFAEADAAALDLLADLVTFCISLLPAFSFPIVFATNFHNSESDSVSTHFALNGG